MTQNIQRRPIRHVIMSLTLILGSLLLISFAHAEVMQATTQDGKVVHVMFDDGNWKVAGHAVEGNKDLRQYLRGDETAENWTEIVDLHVIKDEKSRFTPKKIADKMRRRKNTTVLSLTDTETIYEGYTQKGTRYTLARVFFDADLIYTLFYTTRELEDIESKKEKWLNLLKQAKVENQV